jgi:hypothetical protein
MNDGFKTGDPLGDALALFALEHKLTGCILIAMPAGSGIVRFAMAAQSEAALKKCAGLARDIAREMNEGNLGLRTERIEPATLRAAKLPGRQ